MSKPTPQEIRAALDALEELRSIARGWVDSSDDDPQPTMAEIEWDNDEHFLAEAEHSKIGKVFMLHKSSSTEHIRVIHKNQDGITLHIVHSETLTPTGRRYELAEVQE